METRDVVNSGELGVVTRRQDSKTLVAMADREKACLKDTAGQGWDRWVPSQRHWVGQLDSLPIGIKRRVVVSTVEVPIATAILNGVLIRVGLVIKIIIVIIVVIGHSGDLLGEAGKWSGSRGSRGRMAGRPSSSQGKQIRASGWTQTAVKQGNRRRGKERWSGR
jgi:hypothetical protein